jgi:hypothetical protein
MPHVAREAEGMFEPLDLMRLANHHVYLKLMIDGMPSKPFSAVTVRRDSDTARRRLHLDTYLRQTNVRKSAEHQRA